LSSALGVVSYRVDSGGAICLKISVEHLWVVMDSVLHLMSKSEAINKAESEFLIC